MAITIDQSFIAQFGKEVKHAYQLESKLWGAVRKRQGVIGETSKFQKLGAVSAYTKARNADLTVLEPAHNQVTVTLTDHYATTLADDLDLLKTDVDIKREYVKTVGLSIAQKIDEIIIAALVAGTSAATAGGALTVDRVLEVKKMFGNAKVPPGGRIYVVGESAMAGFLKDTKVGSSDYNSVKALVQGEVDTYLGFKFITVPDSYLTLNETPTPDTRLCFAFHTDAVGVAVGQDPKTSIEWSPDKHAWWVKAVLSMGAAIVDPAGVVEQEVDI
ncbi:phage capsid protein [Hydrogenophaga sp.]|uniref:phage capsid protein n=1 Tax=Hydrogenophaga sp. TaxID=1904254 RepID=UPI002FCA0B0E